MAEARREIVTALKFHRASMKQQELATTYNLDTQSPQEKKQTKTRKIQTLYQSSNTVAATTTTDTNLYSSLSCPPPYWPISTLAPPPPPFSSYHENQDFILPTQTLGLNLNFQNFDNLDHPNIYHKPLSVYSTSSSSTSSSTPSSSSSALYTPVEKPNNSSSSSGLHHHAIMDDEEMEEIRSLGEHHQIEWNDTINLVASARWCSFLKSIEIEAEEGDEYDLLHQFDQNMEFPPWLNDSSCMQHLDDHFSDAYLQDSALPCLDLGEIEAMDGEWLASEED
uniref:uncharacterized protein LOC122602259 n=1 Tax=Erigeron canadensis TaxID=72917 RepID=UPI001CB8F840|nr:uncharacterized protein LOC122602259 [Erigeron canadensis]